MKTLSSSPFAFGSIANAITGAGSVIDGIEIGCRASASQSPARVSLSLATAPMSPGPNASAWRDLLALGHEQLADALLRVGARVEHVRVVRASRPGRRGTG